MQEYLSHFVNTAEMASTYAWTEPILEHLTDKPDMRENETQTDLLLNKPPVTYKKKFVDDSVRHQTTQILAEDNLIDFNVEVEPILSVLLTKLLEQSRMEVLEEEEMRIAKEQKRSFEQIKVSELAEVQRLEANEKRLEEEMVSLAKNREEENCNQSSLWKKMLQAINNCAPESCQKDSCPGCRQPA